jgi:hypothetical protein
MTLRGNGAAEPLFCDNETNTRFLSNAAQTPAHPKDAINDHVQLSRARLGATA